jgi:hypothetical protein
VRDDEKEPRQGPGRARPAPAALSGALAGFAALAAAELMSALVRPEASPVVALGGATIDRTPAAVKDWAIRNFGTADKLVLQSGVLFLLAVFAVVLGISAQRFRRTAVAGVLLFGAVGAAAAVERPDSNGFSDTVPSVAGALVGAVLLHVLTGRLSPGSPAPAMASGEHGDPPAGPGWDRRGFVIAATAAAAASAGAGALGRALNGTRGRDAVSARGRSSARRRSGRAATTGESW